MTVELWEETMGTQVRSGSRAVDVATIQERAARAASGFKSLGIGCVMADAIG